MSLAKPPALQHIPLREMKPGLAKPIATLSLEPDALTARLGLVFEASRDDLDEMQAALSLQAPQDINSPWSDIFVNLLPERTF